MNNFLSVDLPLIQIFGCENIKKGIILMIVGGVEKTTGRDALKLR